MNQLKPVQSERGSGTVESLGIILVAMIIFCGLVVLGGAQNAGGRAASLADLTAISAASALQAEQDPCAEARRVIEANRGRLYQCLVRGALVEVEVGSPVRVGAAGRGWFGAWARARAAAGPEYLGEVGGG